jgi:hypothetical protein
MDNNQLGSIYINYGNVSDMKRINDLQNIIKWISTSILTPYIQINDKHQPLEYMWIFFVPSMSVASLNPNLPLILT